MCGILGVLNFNGENVDLKSFQNSLNIIKHRGPDDEGYAIFNTKDQSYEDRFGDTSQIRKGSYILSETDNTFNLAFGFRRLSILDLSVNGHQPFFNNEKNICIIFNGEVYNYIEIREELISKGYKFHTGTDTEVILNSYIEWGEDCLSRFNGMWAIALYDMRKNILFCSRDRFGVKPFYYYKDDKTFIFASELKEIIEYFRNDPSFKKTLNKDIVYDYLINNFADHTENTFIKNIKHLPPSHYIKIQGNEFKLNKYFSLGINEEMGKYDDKTFQALKNNFSELMHDAVKIRLRADVPLGTCLSGGLDSSAIVTIINNILKKDGKNNLNQTGVRQKSFSAVYEDERYDERKFIEEIVKVTNCDSHYVYPDRKDLEETDFLLKDTDEFIFQLDEPLISTSPYAQYNVMRLAGGNNVTVLLDGQGGDETLGGYEVYFGFQYSNLFRNGSYFTLASELMQNFTKGMEISFRGLKYFLNLKNKNLKSQTSKYYNHDFLINQSDNNILKYRTSGNLNIKLYEDLSRYILPVLLRYEDRNSMKFSIESRTPFLDYRQVKLLFETEGIYKIHNGWSKWILRNAMKNIVPDNVVWRRDKKGFPTPERRWMKILKEEFVKILNEDKNELSEYIDIHSLINNYDSIVLNEDIKSNFLWKIYNFSKWKKMYGVTN